MNSREKKVIARLVPAALILSLASIPALADVYPDYLDTIATVKLANPIYLDSSQAEHPEINLTFPSPSAYKNGKREVQVLESLSAPKQENTSDTSSLKRSSTNEFIPSFGSNDAFAPPSEYIAPQKTMPEILQEANIPEELPQNYHAYAEEIDWEGKIITEIRFEGLNLVKEDIVLTKLKTRNGSVYNAERLQQDLQNIYATGYFTDSMQVVPELKDDDTVCLTFVLNENMPITDISIVGNTVFKTAELMPYVKKLKGQPQNLNLINDSINQINQHYQEKGYILASVSSVDDTSDGKITLGITEGIIEKIVLEGNNKTKDFVIERNIMTRPGSIYNEEYIKKDLARIYSTQIFEDVNRTIEPSVNKEGEYVVTVEVKEGASNSVSIGGGIDSALGAFGSVGYHEKNFLGRGQRVSLTGMIGSGILLSDASIKNHMNYNVELSFFEPYFLNADNSLTSKLYYRDLGSYQVPLAIERRFGISAVAQHKVFGYDNLTTNLGVGYEYIHLKEGDKNKIAKLYDRARINIKNRKKELTGGSFFNISPGVKYSTLDDELMPRDGIVAKANFIEAVSLSNIHHTNGRVAGGVVKYFPIGQKSTFSIGAKAGIKVHGDEMPEVMAFRLGGPYSVRGFKMNGVGTGDSFLMGSAEILTPIPFFDRFKFDILKNMRFAAFVDTGKVFDPTISSKLFDRPLSAITAGVGLRVYIPGVGPISIDYGVPLTNPGHYGKKGGCFTFGTGGIYDNY